jgi:hypothetical protein
MIHLEGLLPTYKIVLEIESDLDVDGLKSFLTSLLNPPPDKQKTGKRLSGVVLAAAETQSSRMGNPQNSDEVKNG